jgi:hypothetical protein
MQCDEFDVRLQKLLDHRRAAERDSQLRLHARACPRCAAQLTATARLFQGLEMWPVPPLSEDFAQRVVQQVAPARALRHARSVPIAVAVAATLLVCALPGLGYLLHSRGLPSRTASTQPLGGGEVAYARSANPPALPPDHHDSSWTRYGQSILVLYPEETRERHRQRVSEFAEDLRPIASPFNAAMTAIRRTIPVGRSADKSPPSASVTPNSMGAPAHA